MYTNIQINKTEFPHHSFYCPECVKKRAKVPMSSPPTVQKCPNLGSEATRKPFSSTVTLVSLRCFADVANTGWGSHGTDLLRGTLVMGTTSPPGFTSPLEHRRIMALQLFLEVNKLKQSYTTSENWEIRNLKTEKEHSMIFLISIVYGCIFLK